MYAHRLFGLLLLCLIVAGFSAANASLGTELSGFNILSVTQVGSCTIVKPMTWLNEESLQSDWSKTKTSLGSSDYIPCYKEESNSTKSVIFRYCPIQSPWTATNATRNFCYATSEACARAEMPQSWCIKCGSP